MSNLDSIIGPKSSAIQRYLGEIRPFDKKKMGVVTAKNFKRSSPKQLGMAYRGTPEAFVKVIYNGGTKNGQQLKAQFDYLTKERDGETFLVDSPYGVGLGEEITIDQAREKQIAWSKEFRGQPKLGHTTHLLVSYPQGTNREDAHNAAIEFGRRAFADDIGGDCFDYLAFTHTDTEHPHTHFIIKNKGIYESNWFSIKRDGEHNLHNLRLIQVETAKEFGIELTATMRFERGLSEAPTPNAAYRAAKEGRGDAIVIDPGDTAPLSRYSPEYEFLMRFAAEDHAKRLNSLADGFRTLGQNEEADLFEKVAGQLAQGKEVDMAAVRELIDNGNASPKDFEASMKKFEEFRNKVSEQIARAEQNIEANENHLVRITAQASLAEFKANVAQFYPENDQYQNYANNRGSTIYDQAAFDGVRESLSDPDLKAQMEELYGQARENIQNMHVPAGMNADEVIARFETNERINAQLAEEFRSAEINRNISETGATPYQAEADVDQFVERVKDEIGKASEALVEVLNGRGIDVQRDRLSNKVDRLADEVRQISKTQAEERNRGGDYER